MKPVLGIFSQTHSLIHGAMPGTTAYHSPAKLYVCLHVLKMVELLYCVSYSCVTCFTKQCMNLNTTNAVAGRGRVLIQS